MHDRSKQTQILKYKTLMMLSLLALTTLSACRSSRRSTPPKSDPDTPTVVIPSPSKEDIGTGGLQVVIRESNYFNSYGLDLLESARSALENVVNTEEFKQRVLGYRFNGTEGYTNMQIYNMIIGGGERLPKPSSENRMMDLYLEYYTSNWFSRNTIGYTYPTTSTIYMNSYFFNYADTSGVAANLMHEWTHKLGFDHTSASDSNSVPYALGNIAELMVSRL